MMPVYTQLRIFLNELQADLSLADTSHSMEEKESPWERLAVMRAKMAFQPLEVGPLTRENWAGCGHPFECDFGLVWYRTGGNKLDYIDRSG